MCIHFDDRRGKKRKKEIDSPIVINICSLLLIYLAPTVNRDILHGGQAVVYI